MPEEEMRIEEAAQPETRIDGEATQPETRIDGEAAQPEMRIDGEAAQPEMMIEEAAPPGMMIEEAAQPGMMIEEAAQPGMMIEEAAQPWADLVPTDVLHLVALRLPPPDFSNFQKVCKPWRSLPMESYPLGRSPLYLFFRRISFGDAKDFGEKLYLYSPLYNTTFSWAASREVLDICYSKSPRYSKDGWVVCLRRHVIIFFNPFLPSTRTAPSVIKWTTPANYSCRMRVSMSAPPTDPACIFLIINMFDDRIEIITGSEGGTNWKNDFFDLERDVRHMCTASPVFHGDVFYCLMMSGDLGIYNPRRRTWKVHDFGNVRSLGISMSPFNVLAESNGELLNISQYGDPLARLGDPTVYKLNESSMEWKELRDLRGRALFLDLKFALSAEAEDDGLKDRIFYSVFNDIAAEKVHCELHRSAGGDLRLVPRSHVGLARLARRAKEELVGISLPYSMKGAGEMVKKRWRLRNGHWFQPNWDNNQPGQ